MKKITLLFIVLLLCLFVEETYGHAENRVLSNSDKQELQYLIKIEKSCNDISSDYIYLVNCKCKLNTNLIKKHYQ